MIQEAANNLCGLLAGALKRVDQEVSEELIMYRTMLDLIKPKLVYLDLPLFMALLSDLFPGVEQPPAPAGALRNAIEADLVENNLQVLPALPSPVADRHTYIYAIL